MKNLHNLYGPLRVEGHIEGARRDWEFCDSARVLASALWIHDAPPDIPDMALTLEAACVFRRTGWGDIPAWLSREGLLQPRVPRVDRPSPGRGDLGPGTFPPLRNGCRLTPARRDRVIHRLVPNVADYWDIMTIWRWNPPFPFSPEPSNGLVRPHVDPKGLREPA